MKNILITGGAGFIGSNLALTLQERYPDANIYVLDDFRGSSFKNLIGFLGDVLAYDVSDRSWMRVFDEKKLDTIFHIASITDTTILDEKKMMYENVEGFRNIIELAQFKNAEVVYASSAAVYGSQDKPMSESDGGIPNNVYGFSKWVFENIARQYEGKVKLVGVRYFNVFGPRESYKGHAASMIYQLYKQMSAGKRPRIFKMGEQSRDHVYVKDVVEGTIGALKAKSNTVFNVGTGEATSFNAIVDALNKGLGTNLEPDYIDNPYDFYQDFTQADISHIQKETGYKPKYSTSDGIVDYVQNYLLQVEKQKV